MRSRSYLFLFLVLGLAGLSTWLYIEKPYKLGLDIQGGVRFTLQITPESLKKQTENIGEVRRLVQAILESRATGLGVTESTVQIKEPDSFIVELPGFTNEKEARRALQTSASIKFYEANTVVSPNDNNEHRRPYDVAKEAVSEDDPVVVFQDRASGTLIEPNLPDGKKNPAYLKIIKSWVDKNPDNPIIEGADLKSASYETGPGGGYIPQMNFSPKGAEKMRRWSRRNKYRRENIAAVLDDRVLSVSPLKEGTELSDNAIIDGKFSTAYVSKLKDLLNSGRLPVDLEEISSQLVQPTIGSQALGMMLQAGIVAFGVISLFLLIYYAFPGFVALLALGLYVLFTITALKLMGATFSLAAIAGFILSVGMAVDANILVFERFKEEMKAGRTLHAAMELGFRRALPAIVDSNACTILTSLVLANLGTGPVKGFAITLIIGVGVSLFTAVTVTRSLLLFMVDSGIATNPAWYAVKRNWFGEKFEATANVEPLQIVNRPKKWFVISLVTIVVGLPFVFVGGLKPNVEFQGGYEVELALHGKSMTPAQLSAALTKGGIEGSNVKLASGGDTRAVVISVPAADLKAGENAADLASRVAGDAGFSSESTRAGGDVLDIYAEGESPTSYTISLAGAAKGASADKIQQALASKGLADAKVQSVGAQDTSTAVVTVPLTAAKSGETSEQVITKVAQAAGFNPVPIQRGGDVAGSSKVSETVRAETIRNAILGVVLSTVLIVLYLAFRFGVALGNFVAGLRFGLSAIGALMHDVLVVIGVTAIVGFLYNWEISALFITSMLTVIGFSVHDTIVIFDRIRENLRRPLRGEDFGNLVNRSITQSFARSINTSSTVIVTLLILLIFGTATPDLKLFTVTMLAGIVSGTYSSIYNASPILFLWDRKVAKAHGEDHSFMGMAAAESQRARAAQLTVPTEQRLTKDAAGKSYGTIKRRTGVQETKRGQIDLDDEEQ